MTYTSNKHALLEIVLQRALEPMVSIICKGSFVLCKTTNEYFRE